MALSLLRTPLRTFLFALGGAGLAWLWYRAGWVLALAVVAALWAGAAALQAEGRRHLPQRPQLALRWLEMRVLEIAVVSAATGAAAIILAVELVVPEDAGLATEALTTVASALTTLVTAVAIEEDKVDAALGAHVKEAFLAAYVPRTDGVDRPEVHGSTVLLPPQSDGNLAVQSNVRGAVTGWERADRHERARELQAYLDRHGIR